MKSFLSTCAVSRKISRRLAVSSLTGLLALFPLAAQAQSPDGSRLFSSAGCAGCHGPSGNGGIGPKLAGNPELAKTDFVLNLILNGHGSMPAFKSRLKPDEIAAVATFIRTNLGNSFGEVTTDDVNKAQGGGSGDSADASSSSSTPTKSDTENPAGGPDDKQAQASSESDAPVDPMAVGSAATDVAQPSTAMPDQVALDNADASTDNWLMYNKGYSGQRYSGLDQITPETAGKLQPVCIAQLGEQTPFQGSPIIYDGSIYVTTAYSTIALDAKTCAQQWKYTYTPQGVEPFNPNRGLAIAGGRVFRGTSDAHFIALDAKTGKLLWNIRPVDSSQGYFLSSAPVVWHDMVFTGTAGADWGAPAQLFAFDVKDGHTVWQFNEVVADTFGGADPASTGGGSNWTSYSLDAKTGTLYVPVGNPAPDFAAKYRPGDNLYTNSVIAIDAASGKLDHYYQQIPNDDLDRDTAAAPILFRAPNAEGKDTLYTAVANKAGHMYVYDETTHKQVYDVTTTTIENEGAKPTTEGTRVCPGIDGGVEWYGPTYDPKNSSIYVGSVDWCTTFMLGETRYTPGQLFFGGSYVNDPDEKAQGWIRAYDAQTGKDKWSYQSDLPVVAGVTPTAGGVILSGELTGNFIALDSTSGKLLYHFYTGGPIGGGVSTYGIDGKQYVAVASGNSSRTWSPGTTPSATVVIFALAE